MEATQRLVTYAGQLGWLWAKPDGCEDTRAEIFGAQLPELPCSELLQDTWQELGLAGFGPNGAVPLTWAEVQSFIAATGCYLRPVEARCLIEMSRAYCVEVSNTNPLRISPMELAE